VSGCSRVLDVLASQPMVCRLPFVTPEDLAVAQAFVAEPGDVFISTFPKTGTTWMQQICHQLRTGGHIDFEEISEEGVVPWLEVGPALGIDVTLPQTAQPRCFKSHQQLSALAHLEEAGGKFLCIFRDPEASLKSYFKFLLAKQAPAAESKDVNLFLRHESILPGGPGGFGGSIWEFYAEYWRCRDLANVKVVVYEHLRKDPAKELRGINAFLGLPALDEARLEKALELSSMQWMSANDHLFDDHHMGPRLAKRFEAKGKGKGKDAGKGKDGKGGHVTVKKVGHEIADDTVITELTSESRELLAEIWRQHMTPLTGCGSYAEMIAQL
jgi:catechol 2,3-dioxygenase-like lactoylglutathione lyase family enzyme